MNINEEKCRMLLDGVELPRNAKVLVSWHEKEMDNLLKRIIPAVRVEYLMDMDFETFVRHKSWRDDGEYDFIFDNGLLADMGMDGVLLRSMGMHLKVDGRLRSVIPASFDGRTVGRCSYANNFNRAILVNRPGGGNNSFYVAEFSCFQRKVTWLQGFYTPELRRELSFLLQRIDFGVQIEESIRELRSLVYCNGIDMMYLRFYVDTAVIHKERLYRLL